STSRAGAPIHWPAARRRRSSAGASAPLSGSSAPTDLSPRLLPGPPAPFCPSRSCTMKSSVLCLSLRVLPAALLCLGTTAALAQAQAQAPLRSAVDATFAPHAMAKLGGGVQGFNVDLGEELAKRLGRKIEIEGAEFSGLVPGLNSKRYDFLVAPVTVTPERAKSLLFTEGYLDTDYTFLGTKASPAIEKLEDLKGKTIAVNKGSNYEGWARDNAAKYGFKFDVYGANADAVQAVQSGRADYNLAGTTVVAWAAKQNPN